MFFVFKLISELIEKFVSGSGFGSGSESESEFGDSDDNWY